MKPSTRSLAVVTLLTTVCGMGVGLGVADVTNVLGPLRCAQSVYSAGEVRSGKTLAHSFLLRNTSSTPLQIREIQFSCGCLRASQDFCSWSRSLAPGESFSVPLEINTITQPSGPNRWRALVRYRHANQPSQPQDYELPLEITASVTRDVFITPSELVLHTNGPLTHSFFLTDLRDRSLKIRAVRTNSPHYSVTVDPAEQTPTAVRYRLTLQVRDSLSRGRHEGQILLVTDDLLYPEIRMPFLVTRSESQSSDSNKVQAIPREVSLIGSRATGLPIRLVQLQLRSRDGLGSLENASESSQSVQVESVECDHAAVRCRWAVGPGTRSTLRVEIDSSRLPQGDGSTQLQVRLSRPSGQVVKIPLRWTLRD